jgi:glycosyltransferase involved in cell wall biosynthesis
VKLLSLTDIYPSKNTPFSGVFIRSLNKALSGHLEVTVIHPRPWPKSFPMHSSNGSSYYERQGSIQVYRPPMFVPARGDRIFMRGLFFFLSTLKLLLITKKYTDFDLVHAHMAVPAGFAGVILSKIFRKPIVITCHGSDLNVYPHVPVLKQMVNYSLKRSDAIVTVSNNLKAKAKALGISDNKIEVIKNGVDHKIFKIMDKCSAKKQLGLKNEGHIILYIGHLTQEKGLAYLLRSMASLLKIKRNVYLFIIGEGKEKRRLSKMISTLGIEKRVFLIGPRPNSEIPIWLGASDLLCLPSFREGLPCVILEALACGRPVVASDIGGIPEVLGGDETLGIMISPKDDSALARALTKALNAQWSAQHISSKMQEWSWANTAQEYLAVFESLFSVRKIKEF